ncbi:unnamed protein product, partial [Prunus brigantina]
CPFPSAANVSFAQRRRPFSLHFEPAGWGAAMEDLHSLLDMRGVPSIFVWEVRCKSSRTFSLRLTNLWSGDFSSFLQPSTQTSSIFLACEFLHPLSSGMHPGIESHRLAQVLYNCFSDCLVALPIAARQQVTVSQLFLAMQVASCLYKQLKASKLSSELRLGHKIPFRKGNEATSQTHCFAVMYDGFWHSGVVWPFKTAVKVRS